MDDMHQERLSNWWYHFKAACMCVLDSHWKGSGYVQQPDKQKHLCAKRFSNKL